MTYRTEEGPPWTHPPVRPGTDQDWDVLVRIWEETDAPEGCKVEIIEEIVTVSPATVQGPQHHR
ncbi:hypothetical protein [Streptomyces sp. CBG30]|uniref:hypothetical protein n=1 Tax=Streptomyces sp. CBG30 TaxID=2838869 RepID=UPI002036F3A4|nr:hypothetical protein [Streptomyces sp. CBG30]